MKVNTNKILAVLKVILCIVILVWFILINIIVMDLMDTQAFLLENVSDIYNMITDVYTHITNLLNMGVVI